MASVYKKSKDKNRRGSSYYFSCSDEHGRRISKKGFTDKRATEALALEVEQQVKRRKVGLVDPKQEKREEASKQRIEELVTDFGKSLSKNSPKHVELSLSRLRRLIVDAEFKTILDIDIDSVEAVLGDMLDADEIGRKTYNHYLSTAYQFCKWLVPNRLAANPLEGIKRLNADVDVRHPRRALSPDEFTLLCKSARESGVEIQCYDGEERARIYTLSFMTGLRRKEIASLTPSSFKLSDSPATVTVEAQSSKHRKKDVLPLHTELVSLLKVWLKGKKRTESIFPLLDKRRTWLMVKKDLERVDIPYRNEEGIADFHAAGRHTHITELLRNGASLPEARELARHSDVRTTMRYTHIGIEDQAKALQKLPWNVNQSENDSSGGESPGNGRQRPGSGASHSNRPELSSTDTETTPSAAGTNGKKTFDGSASDSLLPVLSLADTEQEIGAVTGSIPAAST